MAKIGKNQPCVCGSGRKYKRCCGANAPHDANQYKKNSRQEIWRMRYRARRYMEHLSEEDLIQRHNDIIKNLTLLTDELKIGFLSIDETGQLWSELHTHLMEECNIRRFDIFKNSPKDLKNSPFPNFELKGLDKSVEEFNRLNLEKGKYLVKYGKQQYLKSMIEKGSIRIMPAASYDDPSLNSAIRDNELETSRLILPNEVEFEDFYNTIEISAGDKKGKLSDFFELVGNSKFTLVSNVNFYVYCVAYEHSARLFGDFEADCCIIIKNPTLFLERLSNAFNSLKPNYSAYNGAATYFDPLNIGRQQLPYHYSKHFGYAYQKEYRVIWLPPEKTMKLEPIFLELGNLEDCCEMIEIDPY